MKYLIGRYYVEVKDKRYRIHPTEIIILGERDPSKSLRTQYQVQNETQMQKNQKVFEKSGKLEVKNYPKTKQSIHQQPKFEPLDCPSFKQKIWLEFDKGYYCQNCEYIFNKQNHQIDEKVRRQDHCFSTRFPYANKKIREIWMNMVNTTYITTEDMIKRLQSSKGKTKFKLYRNISIYYDEMNIRNFKFEKDAFSKNARGSSTIYHEVLLLVKSLKTITSS